MFSAPLGENPKEVETPTSRALHMDPTAPLSVLLLDKPSAPVVTTSPDDALLLEPGEAAVALATDRQAPPRSGDEGAAGAHRSGTESVTERISSSPATGVVAAVAILEGYRWLGVIPGPAPGLSALVFGRAGALIVALSTVAIVWAVRRPRRGGHRSPVERAALGAAWIAVIAASVAAVEGSRATGDTFGVAELVVACLAAATLVLDERRRKRAGSHRSKAHAFSTGSDKAA